MSSDSEHRACDLCGRGDHAFLLEKNDAIYTRCETCGFIATGLSLAESEAENASYFEAALDKYIAKAFSKKKQAQYGKRLQRFGRYRKTGRLLDVGANVGGLVHRAQEEGWSAVGVEPVSACCDWARREHGLEMHATTLEEAPLEASSFDGIYSSAVFEHLFSPTPVFEAAAKLLRPGGLLFIDTVNYDSYTRRHLDAGWKLIDPRHHFCLYTPSTLARFCEKVGLEVLRVETHGIRFRPNHLETYRGWRRWVEELKKFPFSAASRFTGRGDSVAVLATKS